MKNRGKVGLVLIGFLISSCIFSIVSSAELPLAQSLDDPAIKSKFEPWLWEKVQKLEANGTRRLMAIGLGINCTSYGHNLTAAYDLKRQMATHLAQEHNANVTTALPTNTVAIKVIIDFTGDFHAWIDKSSIERI